MKKTYKILIAILVFICVCAGVIWWQFGNVRALYYWLRYSDADIDTLMSENSSQVESYLEKNTQYKVRPYSPVEEELHKKGIITDEDLVSLLTGETTLEEMFGTDLELSEDKLITNSQNGEKIEPETLSQMKQDSQSQKEPDPPENETGSVPQNSDGKKPDKPDKSDKPVTPEKEEPSKSDEKSKPDSETQNTDDKKPDKPEKDGETENPDTNSSESTDNTEIAACIAQVYVVKSRFVGELDSIYNQAFSEYKVLWYDMTDEERTAKKKSLLSQVYPKAVALERDCDAQINQILSNLTKLLKSSGEQTALADQIRDSYYSEKSLKKAHYLSLIT